MNKDVEIGQINELKFYLAWDYVKDICDKAITEENQQLKELLKKWMHFYPIILYEHEDTLKTKDIVELFDKTANAIGEKK